MNHLVQNGKELVRTPIVHGIKFSTENNNCLIYWSSINRHHISKCLSIVQCVSAKTDGRLN